MNNFRNAKIDLALGPTTYTGATATASPYFYMRDYDRAIFIVQAGSMTASGNVQMRLLQAPTSTAPAAAITIGTAATLNGTPTNAKTITNAIEAVVQGSSQTGFGNGETITIDDQTYTFKTSSDGTAAPTTGDFNSNLQICSSSSFTTPHDTIAHLAAYINHATYGCTGVVATVSAATSYITLSLAGAAAGNKTMDISISTSELRVYPSKMVGYLEMNTGELNVSSSMAYVAVELTPSTHQTLSAMLHRGGKLRYSGPTQYVTAYDDQA